MSRTRAGTDGSFVKNNIAAGEDQDNAEGKRPWRHLPADEQAKESKDDSDSTKDTVLWRFTAEQKHTSEKDRTEIRRKEPGDR
jgi:hypothetical protein